MSSSELITIVNSQEIFEVQPANYDKVIDSIVIKSNSQELWNNRSSSKSPSEHKVNAKTFYTENIYLKKQKKMKFQKYFFQRTAHSIHLMTMSRRKNKRR
jgi:hypothetical protein